MGGTRAAAQPASFPLLTSSQETADVSSRDLVFTVERYALVRLLALLIASLIILLVKKIPFSENVISVHVHYSH